METCIKGVYEYSDALRPSGYKMLPESLHLCEAVTEAIILRLITGKIAIKNNVYSGNIIRQDCNYTVLPFSGIKKFDINTINIIFNTDITEGLALEECNRYFLKNKKNSNIHEKLLFEITAYFAEEKKSPISAFVHLYRSLELMSYSFPMMYASKAGDYKGSYDSLKKFFSGDSNGELGFFKKFIYELFNDEPQILAFQFDIEMQSPKLEEIRNEYKTIFDPQKFIYQFDGSKFSAKFSDMMTLFVAMRNRYFHMLVGKGQENFMSNEYDINDIFRSMNPYFMNWIASILCKIIQHGFDTSLK